MKLAHFDDVCRDLDRRRDRVLGELRTELATKVRQIEAMTGGRFAPYCGYRGPEEQRNAFYRGTSRAKWGESPHNYHPALACDLVLDPRVVAVREAHDAAHPGWPDLWDDTSPDAVHAWASLEVAAKAVSLVRVNLAAGRDLPHVELAGWRAFTGAE